MVRVCLKQRNSKRRNGREKKCRNEVKSAKLHDSKYINVKFRLFGSQESENAARIVEILTSF